MKKQVLLAIAACFALANANAQQGDFWNKTSLEASYGYAMPLNPTKNINAADYNSFVNFQGGLNYEIDNLWGVRATYAYQKFENKNDSKLGVTYHKFMAEATFNALTAIFPTASYVQDQKFDVIAHAGIGGTFAKHEQDNATNKIVNAQIGLQPIYAVSSRISIFLDATYVMNFNQAYEFSGRSINDGTTGSYLSANVGLKVKLGK